MRKRTLWAALLTAAALCCACAAETTAETPEPETITLVGVNAPPSAEDIEPEEEELPPPFEPTKIHLLAVGDNLFHMGLVNSGLQADGSYNFDFEFAPLAEYLELADIAIINQETPLAGNERGFSGYPLFNSPTEVADAIERAGFNVVLGATNHAYDQGIAGLIVYADLFAQEHPDVLLCGIHGTEAGTVFSPDTALPEAGTDAGTSDASAAADTAAAAASVSGSSADGSDATGTTGSSDSTAAASSVSDSSADSSSATGTTGSSDSAAATSSVSDSTAAATENDRIHLMTIEGYTFAFLNYTYGTNLETYPSNLEGHLDMLTYYNTSSRVIDFETLHPQVIYDIREADALADIVVVCPHWGIEYQTSENAIQRSFAEAMIDAGADVIIGAHPHVVQPVRWITTEAGSEGLCYYSLGNYISTQKQRRSMLEAMAWVTFEDDEDGTLHLVREETGALPIIMQYDYPPTRFSNIYTVDSYTDALGAAHGISGYGEGALRAADLDQWSDELLGGWRLTREAILGLPAAEPADEDVPADTPANIADANTDATDAAPPNTDAPSDTATDTANATGAAPADADAPANTADTDTGATDAAPTVNGD